MSDTRPSLAEVLTKVIDHRLGSMRLCMPGIVVSYDPTKQTATIQPALKNVIQSGEGTDQVVLDFPSIDLVPVVFPRSGAWSMTWPLSPGDAVVLQFGERALDQWRLLGQTGPQDPSHLRMHDLSDAIAVPGNLEPDSKPITNATADHMVIGNQDGSTIHIHADNTISLGSAIPGDAVARASVVDANMQALALAFTTWVPVPGDGGAVLKALLTTLLGTGWPNGSPSSIVKVPP